jgi:hypothetical protein
VGNNFPEGCVTINIGFTGTRHGMSLSQFSTVQSMLRRHRLDGSITGHHGCCVGGDAEFHRLLRGIDAFIAGHPGPGYPNGPLCARVICDFVEDPLPYMQRNRSIVSATSRDEEHDRAPGIMIAAPYEDAPQIRGGTWATIRMALRALRTGKLQALNVVGRNGDLLNHARWP